MISELLLKEEKEPGTEPEEKKRLECFREKEQPSETAWQPTQRTQHGMLHVGSQPELGRVRIRF